MEKKKILITTAIDYTNDVIHVGQAYEKILADCTARYYRDVYGMSNVHFLTGTDEHGTTNEKAAAARNLSPKQHVDDISKRDREQIDLLNISYDRFIRTTDEDHIRIARDVFQRSYDKGDIYKGEYEGLYCEGCESYKTLTELTEDGKCPNHPTREIQKITEENYFFNWSKYSVFLKKMLNRDKFILPEGRKNEMVSFIDNGIKDIPVTRPSYKLSWGIPSPIDPEQVLYVWFDALINYYTFGIQNNCWDEDTRIIHFVGKDIARWHALLWPAMLESAGIRSPDIVYVHGFITLNGDKISKSRGNIIRPEDLVKQFGVDPVRYYFLKYGPITEDVDISLDSIKDVYNSELANGLGNLVSRIAKIAEKSNMLFPLSNDNNIYNLEWDKPMNDFRTDLVLSNIWSEISVIDKHINDNEPWKIKDTDLLHSVLSYEIEGVRKISRMLRSFMPDTAEKISIQFNQERITFREALFPRLQ